MTSINTSKDIKMKSYTRQQNTTKLFRNIVCILLCALSLLPFILLFVNATRTSGDIKAGISFIPGNQLWVNWDNLMAQSEGTQLTLFRSMVNSFTIAVPATALSVYVSSLTAYGIRVYDFKFKKLAWGFIMAIMMIPTQISAIGFYRFMLQIGLTDSYLALIIPAAAAPAVVFFMKQYMEASLSIEIVEAARIDGSGEFRTFNTIVMPLMKPAMATQAIFQFVFSWNNLFMPSIIITSESKKTLPMFVQMLTTDQFKTDYGMVYVGLFFAILPIFIVYFLLARYIVAGVALGGVKE